MGYQGHTRSELVPFVPISCHRLLDIGCNRGDFGAHLKSVRDVEVWGVEPNKEAADEAAAKLDHVVQGYFDADAPLPDGYFDTVVFADSLEHFPDPGPPLELCKLKLAPRGVVVCSLPNVRFVGNLEHLLFEKDWRYEAAGIRDKTHLRFFTRLSMKRTFEEAGFVVHDVTGINEGWWKKDRYFRRLLFRFFPRVTEDMRYEQYVVVASPV